MVRVQGTDYISDTDQVRRLARDVVDDDFTDAQIQEYQYYAYSEIRTGTHKDDWDSGDREFGALQLLEMSRAAWWIKYHYGTDNDYSSMESQTNAFFTELKNIADNLSPEVDEALDENIHIITNDYVSYPAALEDNENAQPYRSTTTSV